MDRHVKVWFDAEGDFLEVTFADRAGYMVETEHDAIMTRVDDEGHVLGFSILGVSKLRSERPIDVDLFAEVV